MNRIIFFILLFLSFSYYNPIFSQEIKGTIIDQVDANNKAKTVAKQKKQEEATSKDPVKEVTQPEVKENPVYPKNDQAPFVVPDVSAIELTDGSGGVNTGVPGTPGEEEEEEPLVEYDLEIDSAAFLKRAYSVKKRDMILYRQGLQNKAPILHQNTYLKKHKLQEDKKVFGWHPYWMEDAYKSYNFSLLSAVTYFSYELNPNTGSYGSIHDWMSTDLIDAAHKQDCKVLLSVTNFGAKNNETFLSNPEAQKNFNSTVIRLLLKRGGDGVHIDFENIPANKRQEFTNFVIALSSDLRRKIPNAWLTIAIPAMDVNNIYNFRQLEQHVNLFIMMGYEFYGFNTKTAGPISLAQGEQYWWSFDLERAVDEYLATGLDPSKMLLGVCYYGAEWETESLEVPSKAKKFVEYSMYRDIKKKFGRMDSYEDVQSMSQYYVFKDINNRYHQIWYEDSLSLSKKYDWAASKKLGGVGIWALGYDNGYTGLWKALQAKYAVPTGAKKKSKLNRNMFSRMFYTINALIRNPSRLVTNPRYLFSMFGMFFGTSMVGFWVLYRYGCRFKRLTNLFIKGGLTTILIVLLALTVIIATNYNSTYIRAAGFILGGFILGALVFLFLSRSFLSEKDLP